MAALISQITRAIQSYHDDKKLTPADESARNDIVIELQSLLKPKFGFVAVTLFGSSVNGFGTVGCDMDLYVPIIKNGGVDYWKEKQRAFDSVKQRLLNSSTFKIINVIQKANVPIISVRHTPTGLSGDINFTNDMGLHHANLLRSYASIDQRVRKMAQTSKILNDDEAKDCLPSFGCMVMMIHFLQRCSPQVLPVLEEIQAPEHLFSSITNKDGKTSKYFNDVTRLAFRLLDELIEH